MKKKIFLKIVLILSLIIITWFVYSEYFKEDKGELSKPINLTSKIEEGIFSSDYKENGERLTPSETTDIGPFPCAVAVFAPLEGTDTRRAQDTHPLTSSW